MKEYIFENILNSNIEIRIKANYYAQAMDLLLSATRNIDDYRLKPDGNELSAMTKQESIEAMTKQEAIDAMKAGAKVTHRLFDPEEWITMEGNLTIITEEGYAQSTVEFWGYRTSVQWKTGWSIWSSQPH